MKQKMQNAECRMQIVAGLMVCAASIASAQGTAAPVVTLSEARQRAITVDPTSVAATQRIRVAGWERRAATADLFAPRLNGSIS